MVVGCRGLRVGACLSLTGRYARFGGQAAAGLQAWRVLDGDSELVVADDGSDPARAESCLRAVASRCDLLLGPYSTQLMRVASRVVPDLEHLMWNHGGSGDDVAAAAPGHVVSVLSPTSRYAEPFVRHLAGQSPQAPLWLARGRGSFGRQVIAGAAERATTLGMRTVRIGSADELPAGQDPGVWDLFCAGSFEEDVARVTAARTLAQGPRVIGAIAAGVRDFGRQIKHADGVYGIAQWFPGHRASIEVGPAEEEFLQAYRALNGAVPDYPAVQAAATAVLATHCARAAGSVARESLWTMATALQTTTMFGAFRIDPVSGAQLGHQTVLVRWTTNGPTAVSPTSASTL